MFPHEEICRRHDCSPRPNLQFFTAQSARRENIATPTLRETGSRNPSLSVALFHDFSRKLEKTTLQKEISPANKRWYKLNLACQNLIPVCVETDTFSTATVNLATLVAYGSEKYCKRRRS